MSYNFSHAFEGEKKKKTLCLKTEEKINKKADNDSENYEESSIETVLGQGMKL